MKRSWRWFQRHATGRHAKVLLVALSFSEASFFIIPPDVLLIALLSAKAGRWVYYATITTLASIAGAIFGYLLGAFAFDALAQPLILLYGLSDTFTYVGSLYSDHAFWAVLTAAFTPIPFKVFVLAGGFFNIPFIPFLFATILGRSVRYFLIAWVSDKFGPQVAETCIKEFNYYTVILVILCAIFFAVYFDVPELFW